jgi:hypothetical protein
MAVASERGHMGLCPHLCMSTCCAYFGASLAPLTAFIHIQANSLHGEVTVEAFALAEG